MTPPSPKQKTAQSRHHSPSFEQAFLELRRALLVVIASVGTLSASSAWATCTTQSGGLERTCTGALTANDTYKPTVGAGQDVSYTFQQLTTTNYTNPSNEQNVVTYGVKRQRQVFPGTTLFNFNADKAVDLTVTTDPLPFLYFTETGGGGGTGSSTSGSGNRSGGGGQIGGHTGLLTSNIEQLKAVTPSFAPSGLAPVLSYAHQAGNGGWGGSGISTGFGDGYGGAGAGGGGNAGANIYMFEVQVQGDGSSGQPNPDGGIGLTFQGGIGGTGGEGRAADYTGGGGSGGPGGMGVHGGNTGSLRMINGTTIVSQSFGVNISSVGGAGGNGGEGKNTLSSRGNGGQGGPGGYGGDISFTSGGSSSTFNVLNGPAIFAESRAGRGGNGGTGASSSGTATGGNGGQGGTGGAVTILNEANTQSIVTTGNFSTGIHARSHGGAGGDGGSADGNIINKGKGGSASGSGPGGAVSVTFGGHIGTNGDTSDAVMAHSVGGFSGNGGSATGFVSYGGGSESAGGGGPVTVFYGGLSDGTIVTQGSNSDGIFAQSVGGGGGKGGKSSSFVALAGSGSAGGPGGKVSVNAASGKQIRTSGVRSRGIVAQSLGGGGGDGGGARGFSAIGGTGGGGGVGGSVTVENSVPVETTGADSIGILAQSTGGGGGNGTTTSGLSAIGGAGGNGSIGGPVSVTTAADISTGGASAPAVFAQSTGGSGGHGSNTHSVGVAFTQSISGTGGSGQTGGTVSVKNSDAATLVTAGINSPAILAQSVGGGGGNAGNDWAITAGVGVGIDIGKSGGGAGGGGAVDVTYQGTVSTKGDNSTGIVATSTGGGGGSAGSSISASVSAVSVGVSVGGNGGGGGAGDTVTLCRGLSSASGAPTACAGSATAGPLSTEGSSSPGIYAASHGGGGGHSSATLSASEAFGAINVTVGGDGGAGGAGDSVNVLSTGGITTTGTVSPGLIAKSVGGSGGAAYMAGSVGGWQGTSVNVTVGGSGGAGKGSGPVTVVSRDDIATSGELSDGIQLLSQAGGGGLGGTAIAGTGVGGLSANVDVGGAGGGGGVGGNVDLSWEASTLKTTGTSSPGITVQSSGGSGGIGGTAIGGGVAIAEGGVSVGGKGGAGGTAGTASVATSGAISTAGSYSDGIYAVSQGGNGGRGGGAITGSASVGDVSVTLGGEGGTGGTGKMVSVTTAGSIETAGANSVGIYAVSQGGNGGRGGFAIEESLNTNFGSEDIPAGNVAVTVGGKGGTGGIAGAVNVVNRAGITTDDIHSAGIVAQSIAGSGGTGGMAYTGTVNAGTSSSLDATVSVGGGGGTGGTASNVVATNTATIRTSGPNSDAIFAQSIGGSGGMGGASYTTLASIGSNTDSSINFGVTVGGGGGKGGKPGKVTATNSGTITTSGASSSGLYLQSIGGNGGKGGNGGTAIITLGDKDSEAETQVAGNLAISVGGAGGTGAVSEAVTANNDTGASITTNGGGAYGIFAQSIGGHGGDGGLASTYTFSFTGKCDLAGADYICQSTQEESAGSPLKMSGSVDFTMGGDGGSGNDGNAVSVHNGGAIQTKGDVSHGIFAQSIGAGGGSGGASTDDLSAFTSNKTGNSIASVLDDLTSNNATAVTNLKAWTSFNFFIGGKGGAAGDGSTVDIVGAGGSVTTAGTNSYGILAQSIGGGGGAGGAASEAGDSHTVSVGGSGSAAGSGKQITLTGGMAISTAGYGSAGILAQSIGGGGGDGGSRGQILPVNPLIANIQIGGKTGASGNGGPVYFKFDEKTSAGASYSFVETKSTQAPGMLFQSIGGGGGSALGGTKGPAKQSSIAVGDSSDSSGNPASGNGASIFADMQGNISTATSLSDNTTSAASHGIVAQSIGGGGGYGGAVVMGSPDRFGTNPQKNSTSGKLPSGDGGPVEVILTGQMTTKGANSVGILAQSVGGGGGIQGNADNASSDGAYIGNFGGTGLAGNVTVNATPGTNITTSGLNAHGIFAQYAGGTNEVTKNTSDVVHVILNNARVRANGDGAFGVFAGATGNGYGPILIDIPDSRSVASGGGVSSGAGAVHGAGIYVKGGTSARINNAGTITSTLAHSGVATVSDGANLTISNTGGGVVIGSTINANGGTTKAIAPSAVSLEQEPPATTRLYNFAGGTVETGKLHQTSVFQNEGLVRVGSEQGIWETRIEGLYSQKSNGVTEFDYEIASNAHDTLAIDGDATMAGYVRMAPLASGSVGLDGRQGFQFLTSTGTIDSRNLSLIPSIAGQYSLDTTAEEALRFTYDIDFRNPTVMSITNENQGALSRHLHGVYRGGGLDGELIQELVLISDEDTYARAMNDIGAELYIDGAITNHNANLRFTQSLMSCADSRTDETFAKDGNCAWISIGGRRLDRDASSDNIGFRADTFQIAAGAERFLDNDWTIGGAFSYEDHSITIDNSSAYSDGKQYQAGLSAKKDVGAWEIGAAMSLSYGSLDNRRAPLERADFRTDQHLWSATGIARATRTETFGQSYIKPWVGFGASTLWRDELRETPTEDLAIFMPSEQDSFFFLDIGAEWGTEREIANLGLLKATLTTSITQYLGSHDVTSSVALASAPADVTGFKNSTSIDQTQLNLDAGLDLFTKNNIAFRAELGGTISENAFFYGAGLRAELRF